MSLPIPLDAVEARFRQHLAEAEPAAGPPLTMRRALDLMCRFYLSTPIAGVDTSDADHDMLLFQWGTYGHPSESGRRFCLDVTRQFLLEGSEEFWQLSLSLYFPPEQTALGVGTRWSADYETLADWRREVEQPELAELWDVPAARVEIRLSET